MKKVLIILFLFSYSCVLKGQNNKVLPIDSVTQKIFFEKIIAFDSLDKIKLFGLCNEWIVYNYKDSKEVIKSLDRDNSQIIGKGIFTNIPVGKGLIQSECNVEHTFTIKVKDKKIKVTYTDMEVIFPSGKYNGVRQYTLEDVLNKAGIIFNKQKEPLEKSILIRLEETMQSIENFIKRDNNQDW